ncbi:MAG TPA: hypothetical protein DCM08_10520 [Microscillaceae bacterium]|jgi:hypothetical protein|nr:hypothetical protein [Microscillaceae bacterium]
MFIPPRKYLDQLKENQASDETTGQVFLKNNHLIVPNEIAEAVFGEVDFVYLSFKPDVQRLFVVSFHDEVFRKLHEPTMQMLKKRGELPERSIALHEVLIDNDLAQTDRILAHEVRNQRKMLVIQF